MAFNEMNLEHRHSVGHKQHIKKLKGNDLGEAQLDTKAKIETIVEVDSSGPSTPTPVKPAPSEKKPLKKWQTVYVGGKGTPDIKLQRVTAESRHTSIADQSPRSSTWLPDRRESDVIKAVRERLTIRKVSDIYPPLPSSIVLNEASPVSTTQSSHPIPGDEANSATTGDSDQGQSRRRLLSYVITNEDVDSIVRLIRSSFSGSAQDGEPGAANAEAAPGPDAPRRVSVTGSGVFPYPSLLADPGTTNADAEQPGLLERHITFSETKHPSLEHRWTRKSVRKTPRPSAGEIIWDRKLSTPSLSAINRNTSSTSLMSMGDVSEEEEHEDRTAPGRLYKASHLLVTEQPDGYSDASSQGEASPTSPYNPWLMSAPAHPSISQISAGQSAERLLGVEVIPPDEIVPADATVASPLLPEIVSFPPLPSRSTMYWKSPLPDITIPIEARRSSEPSIKPPIAAVQLTLSTPEIIDERHPSPRSSVSVEPGSLLQPRPEPRIWDPSKPGSAMGSSSRERRKSSSPNRSPHFRLDDEDLYRRLSERTSSWHKPRKDSGWPTPESRSSIDAQSARGSVSGIPSRLSIASQSEVPESSLRIVDDRMKLIEELEPPLSTVDNAGIYQMLSGGRSVEHEDVGKKPGLHPDAHVCGAGESRKSSRLSTDWIG
jgi:hypothetical protein